MSEHRISIIPAGAVTDPRLEPRDLQVLCLLGRHTNNNGWCWRSQVRMAKEIRCGRSSVQRSVDRLCETGWVEKKPRGRGDAEAPEEGAQPFAPYAYRVCLDHDPEAIAADVSRDEAESLPTGGHPGAQPYVGTPCPDIHGHHERLSEGTPIEQAERDARARGKRGKLLDKLKSIWPTAALDDQERIDREWAALSEDQIKPAVDRAPVFLAELKRQRRDTVPALWKYLSQRRWEMLKDPDPETGQAPTPNEFDDRSEEWTAWTVFYRAAGQQGIPEFMISTKNGRRYARFASQWPPVGRGLSPDTDAWVDVFEGEGQISAWIRRLREGPKVNIPIRRKMVDGKTIGFMRVPCEWPPNKGGSDPPRSLSDEDAKAFTG